MNLPFTDPKRNRVNRNILRLHIANVILIALAIIATRPSRCLCADGQHDMLVLLPDGPVHLRIFVVDGNHSLQALRRNFLDRLVTTLDTDQDGKLSQTETSKHPLFVSGQRFDDNPFLQALKPKRHYTAKEVERVVDRTARKLVSYRQENSIAERDLIVFRVLDKDSSGKLDAEEMRLAASRISARDRDLDQCVTFDEFLEYEESNENEILIAQPGQETLGAVQSELLRDAREPSLPARVIRKYDANQDDQLTPTELGWNSERIASLDVDSNGRINAQEFSRICEAKPDAIFSIDLNQRVTADRSGLSVVEGEDAKKTGDAVNHSTDFYRLARKTASLQIGYRFRDPLAESKENANAAFNAIDRDGNGYLDTGEMAQHRSFARTLFDAIDRDNDGRVFAQEMQSYVKDYTEPASMTCQVTLFDNGNGFFQLLDENSDSRISVRELRNAERRLRACASGDGRVNPSKMKQSYRMEIQRGGTSLLEVVNRASSEKSNAILKTPSGPIWFQRMDRNGDGDLTWDEFVGPRKVFHQLDADLDGLIDESEATKFVSKADQ